jgi:hypothetical protein
MALRFSFLRLFRSKLALTFIDVLMHSDDSSNAWDGWTLGDCLRRFEPWSAIANFLGQHDLVGMRPHVGQTVLLVLPQLSS